MTHRILLDTDIGTDVDDSLALAVILGSPEAELVGVTTVYGDTIRRARIARRLLDLAGVSAELPVVAGECETFSGRPVWWPGHEGRTYRDLDSVDIDTSVSAVEFLVSAAAAHPGELDLVAVGPLTNVAAAILRDPAFATNLRSIHLMGAEFAGDRPEHNIRSDSAAAKVVFESPTAITVMPVDITRQIRLHEDHVGRIGAAGALGRALRAEIEQWVGLQKYETFSIPHDAANVVALVEPSHFSFEHSDVQVNVAVLLDDPRDGATVLDPRAVRSTVVVRQVDGDAVVEQIVARVCAAGDRPTGVL